MRGDLELIDFSQLRPVDRNPDNVGELRQLPSHSSRTHDSLQTVGFIGEDDGAREAKVECAVLLHSGAREQLRAPNKIYVDTPQIVRIDLVDRATKFDRR